MLRTAAKTLTVTTLALLAHAALAATEPPPTDLKTGQDHPVLKRFAGSMLVGYRQQEWAATTLPSATGVEPGGKSLAHPLALEGKVTRLLYTAPKGKAPLEVFRNYQQALVAAGFKPSYVCDAGERGCTDAYFALDVAHSRLEGMARSTNYIASREGGSYGLAPGFEEGRVLAGALTRGGQALHLVLYTSYAVSKDTDTATTYVEIVEPKAMQTGQVTVDAKAIGQGLQAEGKVALYGLFFDTGKAAIKPESKPQLDEMAKLLQTQAAAKVFVVGHTDNVGAFDANQALSLARAQAVVAALSGAPYKIDVKRLSAKGAANIAPVASNADEGGRAKNRRVEMVLQ